MAADHRLSALVRDEPYVLTRITGLFSHRGHAIRSFTVTQADHARHHRIELTVQGDPDAVDRAVRHLEKMHDVLQVTRH